MSTLLRKCLKRELIDPPHKEKLRMVKGKYCRISNLESSPETLADCDLQPFSHLGSCD